MDRGAGRPRRHLDAVFALNAPSAAPPPPLTGLKAEFVRRLRAGVAALAAAAGQGASNTESFGPAVRAGARYVWYSPEVRRILVRVALFVLPASVVWGLLPLVAREELDMGSRGYGVLVPHPAVAIPALVLAGLAWMALVSRMNAAMQLYLPNWVRARGFATYQVVFAGSQAAGAVTWGQVTNLFGLRTAFLAAAVALVAGTVTVRWLPLHTHEDQDREPVEYWPEPHLMLQPDGRDGPVMIQAVWTVPERAAAAFVQAMEEVRVSRLRTGATRWSLFRDGAAPEKFVEVYLVPTWAEHLEQHEDRLTGEDEEVERAATELAAGPPEVTHLLPAHSDD